MRIVIQRVGHASVTIEGEVKSAIKQGYLILLGIEESDTSEDVDWLVRKVIGLRVFDDEKHVMNRSIMDVNGEVLVISQFTLFDVFQAFRTCWLPGPEYWNRMTGYFLLASKSTGFTIQPSSFTPSEVVNEKVSRLPQLYF